MIRLQTILGGLLLALSLAIGGQAAAAASIQAQVTLHAGGLRVAYALPAAVERFAFEEAVADVRADTWHVPADMTLVDGVLTRKDGRPFRAFTIEITPDSRSRDRRYPALTAVGAGWQVYGPYFRGDKTAPPVTVRVAQPKGWQVSPAAARTGSRQSTLPVDGYAYLGPSAYVRRGKTTVVVAPNVEPALAGRIARTAEDAARYYSARLGVTPPATPTLIVTRLPGLPRGMHGDTTDGPVISLRLLGDMGEGPRQQADLLAWVDHEIFHLWNSRFYRSRDGDKEAWLHEGMAEYAALRASREQGVRSEAQVAEALAERLTGCASALGTKAMAAEAPRRGSGVYDCGVLVQWIADLQSRKASAGREDVFDVWRRLFARAKNDGGQYDADGFLAVAGGAPGGLQPLQLLMRPGGPDRWSVLVDALNDLGAHLAPTRSAEAEREQILYHLLRQSCRGGYGFYGGDPAKVKLDTGDGCGVLNGDPVIDAVAGRNIMSDVHAAWDAATAICAAGGQVQLSLEGQPVAAVACTRPMPARPAAWSVQPPPTSASPGPN